MATRCGWLGRFVIAALIIAMLLHSLRVALVEGDTVDLQEDICVVTTVLPAAQTVCCTTSIAALVRSRLCCPHRRIITTCVKAWCCRRSNDPPVRQCYLSLQPKPDPKRRTLVTCRWSSLTVRVRLRVRGLI